MAKRPPFRYLQFMVLLAIFSASWTAALAGEPVQRAESHWLQDPLVRPRLNTMPLLYTLPDFLPADHPSLLTIKVLHNGRATIRQMIELPADLPETSVIAVLADHPHAREHLRRLDSARPGSIRLSIWLGDQLLQELSLREIEEETRRLTPLAQPTAGTTRQVDILDGGGLARITDMAYEDGRDPLCVQGCEEQRLSCIEGHCDPRSTYCPCNGYYDGCVLSCPTCPTSREWTTTTYSDTAGSLPLVCLSDQDYYRKYTRTTRTTRYRETRNCDGTVTTTVISESNTTGTCWKWAVDGPCIPNPNYPPIQQLCVI